MSHNMLENSYISHFLTTYLIVIVVIYIFLGAINLIKKTRIWYISRLLEFQGMYIHILFKIYLKNNITVLIAILRRFIWIL